MKNLYNLSNIAVKTALPGNNSLIFDNIGIPSVMVRIPKLTYRELGIDDTDTIHPAFIVNGVTKDAIYISKYQNVVTNNRAYSMPGETPTCNISFDNALSYCKNKGEHWHLMTRAEWALIALLCLKNSTTPRGNNSYGKDVEESESLALVAEKDSQGRTKKVATGTGPASWSHDGTVGGVFDLNGNVYELVGGIRFVNGELQLIDNNAASDSSVEQSREGTYWKAVDATTGELIKPDGLGRTVNSVKFGVNNGVFRYSTETSIGVTATLNSDSLACDSTISESAKALMRAYALIPLEGATYKGDIASMTNAQQESLMICGGDWTNRSEAGVFCVNNLYSRSGSKRDFIGFRAAYYE